MFRDDVARAVIAAAEAHKIEPAALLAIVEIESEGKLWEKDGRTPQFLYERHVAWKEASKAGCLRQFRAAGLAIPHWDRAHQYKDQRTSEMRLDLMRRASAINKEVAFRSASWGLGQTMGFLAEELGFPHAVALVEHQTGSIAGQIDCMVRELQHSNLIKSLNAHDWERVARIYNGKGYKQNRYDTRLRSAYIRWSRQVGKLSRPTPPEQNLAYDEVKRIQQRLRDLGYYEVGRVDGRWGSRTAGAISAFQHDQGLTVNGQYDDATKQALEAEEVERPTSFEREQSTAHDLREEGSKTIEHADNVTLLGRLKQWFGLGLAGGSTISILDKAQDAADKADQAKGLFNRVSDWFGDPKLLLIGIAVFVAGCAAVFLAEQIRSSRLSDHQSGKHAGTG